jgi:hypothetical protein
MRISKYLRQIHFYAFKYLTIFRISFSKMRCAKISIYCCLLFYNKITEPFKKIYYSGRFTCRYLLLPLIRFKIT